jgi:hypothetical protein
VSVCVCVCVIAGMNQIRLIYFHEYQNTISIPAACLLTVDNMDIIIAVCIQMK